MIKDPDAFINDENGGSSDDRPTKGDGIAATIWKGQMCKQCHERKVSGSHGYCGPCCIEERKDLQ